MLTKLRVLGVDDSETIRINLKQIFKRLDLANFELCKDGDLAKQTLEAAANEDRAFDLVFCDWNMPTTLGIDVLKWVRSHENSAIKRVKFVMITSSDEKIRMAVDLGANNFVAKPLNEETIRRKIDLVFL